MLFFSLSVFFFFFSSRRRHTRFSRDWSSDVCSSDLDGAAVIEILTLGHVELPVAQPIPHGAFVHAGDAGDMGFSVILRYRSEERRVGKECSSRRPAVEEIQTERCARITPTRECTERI